MAATQITPQQGVYEIQKGESEKTISEDHLAVIQLGFIRADLTRKGLSGVPELSWDQKSILLAQPDHSLIREVTYDGWYLDDSGERQCLEKAILDEVRRMHLGQKILLVVGGSERHL
jgi:hypothetical protein